MDTIRTPHTRKTTPTFDHAAITALCLGIVGAIVAGAWYGSLEPTVHYLTADEPADPTGALLLMGLSAFVFGLGCLYFIIRFAIQDALLLTEYHIEDADEAAS